MAEQAVLEEFLPVSRGEHEQRVVPEATGAELILEAANLPVIVVDGAIIDLARRSREAARVDLELLQILRRAQGEGARAHAEELAANLPVPGQFLRFDEAAPFGIGDTVGLQRIGG